MTEYIYRPTRRRNGRRVQSPLWSGAYSIARGEKPRRVALHTPDKVVALKKLREIIIEKQREREGIIAPEAVRHAAALPVALLIESYRTALAGLGRDPQHVQGTANRLSRMASEIGWRRLFDVRPDTFTAWISRLKLAAKTRKEYQVSANAWLNWLVKTEQLPRNPLARLDQVDIRGKQVRESRSLSREEIERWLSISGKRRVIYLLMLYTGMRRGEVKKLRWADAVDLQGERPYFLLRVEATKGKKKRPIPLHPALIPEIRAAWSFYQSDCIIRSASVDTSSLVFPVFPRWATLQRDFRAANIPHRDASGRVVHFHALRKTFQTLGVSSGVNQRSAQALLGHSDPSLTAGPYTDVAALDLHREVERLPWLGGGVATDAPACASPATSSRFRALLGELINLAQVVVSQEKTTSEEVVNNGGRHRTRTCDPIRVKDVL